MIDKLILSLKRLKARYSMPHVRVICKDERSMMPKLGSLQAAGYDLTSVETVKIPGHSRRLIHTGLWIAPPAGYHIEIRPRSGLALKHGITVLNTPGTIDADYRGELMVLLFNTSPESFEVKCGDRIAQAVVMKHASVVWEAVETFESTERGENGFGSTGKR